MSAADRPLDSDELGNKGEKAFEQLCVDAKLICNQAGRDRSGWDYIVEARIDHKDGQSLDQRQNPLSCAFQQKTMWIENDRITFRLSSLERLAKDPRPSFVYVIKVDNDLRVAEAFIIHMMDDVLAFVLGKLREEQSHGRSAVNQAEVSLRASKVGKKIAPTGAALLTELNVLVKGDMNAYMDMKRVKLETLGFEPYPHELKFTMHLDNAEDLANAFLGLKSSIRVSALENYETRFGIRIKGHDFPADGEIKFEPKPADSCMLTFRKQTFGRPVNFRADVYFVPPMIAALGSGPIALVKARSFEFVLRKGKMNVRIPEIHSDTPTLPISDWINHFRLITLLQGGNFSLDIQPALRKKFRMELSEPLSDIDIEQTRFFLQCAEQFSKLLESAGIPSSTEVGLRTFVEQNPSVKLMCGFIDNLEMKTPLSFTAESSPGISAPEELQGIYLDYLIVGSSVVVISVDAHVKRQGDVDSFQYTSDSLAFRDIDVIDADEYPEYVRKLNALSGVGFVFSREHPLRPIESEDTLGSSEKDAGE